MIFINLHNNWHNIHTMVISKQNNKTLIQKQQIMLQI